jgi:hypothetical protein
MKHILSLLLVTLATGVSAAPNSEPSITPTNAPSSIELHDQFDAPQTLSFPATNVTLSPSPTKTGRNKSPAGSRRSSNGSASALIFAASRMCPPCRDRSGAWFE